MEELENQCSREKGKILAALEKSFSDKDVQYNSGRLHEIEVILDLITNIWQKTVIRPFR